MKQIISALFLCMLLSGVPGLQAQNIQLHYDFGRSLYDKDLQGRPLFTSTVEKFHPDTWGSTYFFVDMDNPPLYSRCAEKGPFQNFTSRAISQ